MGEIDFATVVPRLDAILRTRGLTVGLGRAGGRVCVEAAVCEALGLPHSDDPQCVSRSVRRFKISLNDAAWSSPQARAAGLRDLAIAQLGTHAISDVEFSRRMAEKTIRVLIPRLFRELFPSSTALLEAANRCEVEGSASAAWAAAKVAREAWASEAAEEAAKAAEEAAKAAWTSEAAWAAEAARAAGRAAAMTAESDRYLILSAQLAVDVLRDMGVPGVAYLDAQHV